jgi:NTE family protein
MVRKALCISGGGSKGAYSLGVIKALLESGQRYDVITGVSVGALIGAHFAMYPKENQLEAYERIEKIWFDITGNESIFRPWAPSFLTYIFSFWKGGIYDMSPLREILTKEVSPEKILSSGIDFEIGVCSIQSGRYKSINLSSDKNNNNDAIDWIWASCIFPVLFPPVTINGEQWVDGGVKNVIPIKDVIKYNIDEVDVVITGPRKETEVVNMKQIHSAMDVGLRSAELLSDKAYSSDLEDVSTFFESVKIRIFEPKIQVNDDSFSFQPQEIRKLIQQGYEETIKKIAND